MSNEIRYTVVGAGHGGKAMAADLAAKGFTVNLYNRTAERISEIALRGEIDLQYESGASRCCRLAVVTSDIAEALDGADVIMVVVPASGHRDIARSCAPHLRDGQIVARHMWTLSLVFDHRLVDGAPAARFLQYIKELVEEPYLWVAEGDDS